MSGLEEHLSMLSKTTDSIQAIRRWIAKSGISCHSAFIRYKHVYLDLRYKESPKYVYEYTTAIAMPRKPVKRNSGGSTKQASGHIRWIQAGFDPTQHFIHEDLCEQVDGCQTFTKAELAAIATQYANRSSNYAAEGEDCRSVEREIIEVNLGRQTITWTFFGEVIDAQDGEGEFIENPLEETWNQFYLILGHIDGTSLWVRNGVAGDLNSNASLSDLHCLCEQPLSGYSVITLRKVLGNFLADEQKYVQALKSIGTIAKIYKLLPQATISIRVFEKHILNTRWVQSAMLSSPKDDHGEAINPLCLFQLSRPTTFSCIAMMDSGEFDLEPTLLSSVMALSVDNSIYVTASLVCDPYEVPDGLEVRRVFGNVGRPGLTFLISPQNPRIRPPKLDSWNLINHCTFYGDVEDHFCSTSLHLTLTGSWLPVAVESCTRDFPVSLCEALISVHEAGEWVADLDALNTVDNIMLLRVPCPGHRHQSTPTNRQEELTAISNWAELLERPNDDVVALAHNNWQARLAIASVALMQNSWVVLLQGEFCYRCVKDQKTFAEKTTRVLPHAVSDDLIIIV